MNKYMLRFGWMCLAVALPALGRDLYVDPDHGDDAATGLAAQAAAEGAGPLKSIARAVVLVRAGDTIHLAQRALPYHESITLHSKSGAPGNPFVIDGHGATLTGVDPLRPADWVPAGPGLHRCDRLYKDLKGDDSVIQRMFFLFDGQAQHMGRTSKGYLAPFKEPQELKPGEWTFQSGSNAFYVCLAPGQALADAHIEIPYRACGVATRGAGNGHFIVRNLVATHFLNDGFNLHGECVDARFENIGAYENGDDGFSAHETCETTVDGYWAMRNSTGVCNCFNSTNRLFNAYLGGNYGVELMGFHASVWDVRNVVIEAATSRPVSIFGYPKAGQVCHMTWDNVQIKADGDYSSAIEVLTNGVLHARRVTTVGPTWRVQGDVNISDSVLVGPARGFLLDGDWRADTNVYAQARFRAGSHASAFADFDAYRQATRQDGASRCLTLATNELRQALQSSGQPFPPAGAVRAEMKLPAISAGFSRPVDHISRPPRDARDGVGKRAVDPT